MIRKIDKIIQNCQLGEMISDTGNKCIDALINVKYATAKEKGIDFAIKIYIPEELPIDQCDLGIVVGNALDNAIEATEKVILTQKNRDNYGGKKGIFGNCCKESI